MKRIIFSVVSVILILIMCVGLAGPVFAAGSCPIAENLELTTYRNVSVGGNLSAYDPEDDVVSYQITTEPVKGSIKLEQDGSFVYTPDENRKGRDYFGYKALDTQGNLSQEATVIIRIEKQKTTMNYTDMAGRAGEYASVILSEAGIFTGEKIGGAYCFGPEKEVSKGEFLCLCTLASEKPVIKGVFSTGYTDDDSIPFWMKEYVATAAMQGMNKDGDTAFNPDMPISKSEAAIMLDDALGLEDVDYLEPDFDPADSGIQACINLNAAGILEKTVNVSDNLTREEAAILLVKAINTIKNR